MATDDQGATSVPVATSGTLGSFAVLDNSDPGYSEIGTGWTDGAGARGLYANSRQHAAGTGDKAQWVFDHLMAGSYEVQVTWVGGLDRASDAPFAVTNGTNMLATLPVDQRSDPTGTHGGSVCWCSMGEFQTGTGTLAVELSDNADGVVQRQRGPPGGR